MATKHFKREGGGLLPHPNYGDAYKGEVAPVPNPQTDGGHYMQLRPTCHHIACNYAQDRLGYVGQQKQVAKTTNTKRTDTNKEPP